MDLEAVQAADHNIVFTLRVSQDREALYPRLAMARAPSLPPLQRLSE